MSSIPANFSNLSRLALVSPLRLAALSQRSIQPGTQDVLRQVLGSGFDLARQGGLLQQLGQGAYLQNPALALGLALVAQGLQQQGLPQGLPPFASRVPSQATNEQLRNAPLFAPDEVQLMSKLPPEQQALMTLQRGIQRQVALGQQPQLSAGQQSLLAKLPPDQQRAILGQVQQSAATAAPVVVAAPPGAAGAAVAAGAGVIPTGLNPAGNSNADLVNTIANAPLFSPDEANLMKNLPPEQQAMMTLQAKKQRESLMTSVLTNIANMKHESLKGIAQNLRG